MNSKMNAEREFTATAPGNLLVCGEYIILEDGGTGIGMAAFPLARGRARRSTAKDGSILLKTAEGLCSLNSSISSKQAPFIIKVQRSLIRHLQEMGYNPPPLEVEIETTHFFLEVRKLGLGASAAATALLSGLMFAWTVENPDREMITRAALQAHRDGQDGRGSGYDVFASCYGSAGVFVGGREPRWLALKEDHPIFTLPIYSFPGPREVDSRWAITQYRNWQKGFPEKTAELFAHSQKLTGRLQGCRTEEEFLTLINELRLLSTEIGERISVRSWMSPPSAFYEPIAWKGSGAGNEIGLLFRSRNSNSALSDIYKEIKINTNGLCLFDNGEAVMI